MHPNKGLIVAVKGGGSNAVQFLSQPAEGYVLCHSIAEFEAFHEQLPRVHRFFGKAHRPFSKVCVKYAHSTWM